MKTVAIRIIAIVVVCYAVAMTDSAQSKECARYSILAIERIGGVSDSPVSSVLISDSEAGVKWYRPTMKSYPLYLFVHVYVVNPSLLKNLIVMVNKIEKSGQIHTSKSASSKFYTVRVTIITPFYDNIFLYDKKDALFLLENMQKVCSKNEYLCKDIANFRDRIQGLYVQQ